MYYRTTIYIRDDLLARVDNAADKLDVSRSRLISMLLLRYMDKNQGGDKAFEKLQYQERRREPVYVTKGLYLRKDVYERWCYVRVAFKLSASFVIARAIDLYLTEIFEDGAASLKCGSMYITNTRYFTNVYTNITIWGFPDAKQREILQKLDST